jgi:nucleoside 2-deoxyribosyltransferase
MQKPKVYLASKIRHAPALATFRAKWCADIMVTSRWLDMTHLELDGGMSQDPDLYSWCWAVDVTDVMQSNYLIVYGEPEDQLRGACVEAGVALGLGIPVFCVGLCPSFGSWQYHPQVTRTKTLDRTAEIIIEWFKHIKVPA